MERSSSSQEDRVPPNQDTVAAEDNLKENPESTEACEEEEVVVVEKGDLPSATTSADEEQKLLRKRRRKLQRLLRPGVIPSFVALITPDDESSNETPKRIRIDVDDYLGLKKTPQPVLAQRASQRPDVTPSTVPITLPADEGWYEGVAPMVLPEDERYVGRLHYIIRTNLEYFSATAADTTRSQAGRRTPVVIGKVGIRCIHCARAALDARPKPDSIASSSLPSSGLPHKPWPAGSISYPVNIAGLYPVCTQKPQLHFLSCPNLPVEIKAELYELTHDSSGNPKRQRKSGGMDDESKMISAVTYYAIAAKRLGLTDVKDGIRFGRDLSLEPLPLEAARAQVEETPAAYRRTGLGSPSKPNPPASNAPRITADEESERILAEAIAENDNDKKLLACSSDRNLVSDFVFLCIKQMAICHAVPSDFGTRGKKTKLMRVGFAGFCCRHCSHIQSTGFVHNIDFTCRSFASAADNMASAISNSFYAHLQKCFLVPVKVKKALSAYKRIHSRQLGRLPYGSQRRLFHLLWDRLRASDIPEAEMEEKIKEEASKKSSADRVDPGFASPGADVSRINEDDVGMAGMTSPDAATSQAEFPDNVASATDEQGNSLPGACPVLLPTCEDEETQRILKAAEQDPDPSANDNLILPSDRFLITDFVFVMMKQLRVAQPNAEDFSRGKRSTTISSGQAGFCCKHCMLQDQFNSSGRSFPSQPDNMASSLNTSLYQHMQKCYFVSDEMKRALVNLKKIHSAQVSNLRFGSQRRFFNLVFARLQQVEVKEIDLTESSNDDVCQPSLPSKMTQGADDATLARFGFVDSHSNCFLCQHCRMVPMELRSSGSFSTERPTEDFVHKHQTVCKGDAFDLHLAADALKEIIQSCPAISMETALQPSFKAVIRVLVGGNEKLVRVFSDGVVDMLRRSDTSEQTHAVVDSEIDTKGLWCQFPATVDIANVKNAFEIFAQETPGVSPRLTENSQFLRYFQLVSPAFVMQVVTDREQESSSL